MQEFPTRLYIDASGTPVSATATIDGYMVVVNYDDKKLEIPVREIKIEEAGHLADRVKISHKESGAVLVFNGHEWLDELERIHPELEITKKSKAVKGKVKHSGLIRLSYIAGVLGLIGAVLMIFYLSFDFWVDMAADRIPPDVEVSFGDMILPEKGLVKDEKKSKRLKRVNEIANKLLATIGDTPYKFKFYVEKKKELNAYSLPGGNIVMLSKLIDEAKSDDEIAGVLAHEIGHVVHRDSLRRILHTSGLGIVVGLVCGGVITHKKLAVLLPAVQELERLSYSRGQENDADMMAVELTLKAGYRPEALIEFFQRLKKEEEGIPDAAFLLFSDHPMAGDRIKMIRAEARKKRKELGIAQPQ